MRGVYSCNRDRSALGPVKSPARTCGPERLLSPRRRESASNPPASASRLARTPFAVRQQSKDMPVSPLSRPGRRCLQGHWSLQQPFTKHEHTCERPEPRAMRRRRWPDQASWSNELSKRTRRFCSGGWQRPSQHARCGALGQLHVASARSSRAAPTLRRELFQPAKVDVHARLHEQSGIFVKPGHLEPWDSPDHSGKRVLHPGGMPKGNARGRDHARH